MVKSADALNIQQQEVLNKIMSVPTNPVPTQSYQVPELSPQVTPTPTPTGQAANKTQQKISVSGIVNPDDIPMQKKSSIGTILIVVIGVIALIAYTFFWLKLFKYF